MKLNQYLTILGVSAALLASSAVSWAEANESQKVDFELATNEVVQPVKAEEKAPDLTNNEDFVQRVRQELNLSMSDYRQLLNTLSDTKVRLELVSEEKTTLKEQLDNLDKQIDITNYKLVDAIGQIIQKENEIALLYDEIDIRGVAVEYQKNLLKDYFKVMYKEENQYFTVDADGSINAMKLLLSDGTVSDTLQDLDYLALLNETGAQILDKLQNLMKELEGRQLELSEKKDKLDTLKNDLALEKQQLDLQKESKEQLLRLTLGQETIYNQLLEQSMNEQEQMVSDIKNLSNAVAFIERKMEEDGDAFDAEKYKGLLDYKTKVLYDFQISSLGLGSKGFAWPVDPKRGVSAFFRDPSYVGVFGVQHSAIDIPQYQGTPVRAAADGVVYSARDNGYGYSYVVIAHADGFTSAYGHVSSILVSEGQTVAKGSIIALSGGMPGTLGAGYMTTGPHLHFEMRLNGSYVDPLAYLPIKVLTEDQVGNLPEKYQVRWNSEIEKSLTEPISRF